MSTLIVTKPLLARLGQGKLAESLDVRADGDYLEGDWILGSSLEGDEMLVAAVHCRTQWAFLVGTFVRRQNPDLPKVFHARLLESLQAWGVTEAEAHGLFGGREQVSLCRTRDPTLMGQAAAAALDCLLVAEALRSRRRRTDASEFLEILNQRRVKALGGSTPMDLFDTWLSVRRNMLVAPTDLLVSSQQDVPDLGQFWELFEKYVDRDNGARSLPEVEGFMCAVQVSPGQMHPLEILYGILGTAETNWESLDDLNALLSEFARWSNHLVRALGGVAGSFSPVFVGPSNRIDTAAAVEWCRGFAHGWLFKFGELPIDELADAVFLIVSQSVSQQPQHSDEVMTIDGQRLVRGPAGIAPAVEWLFKTCQKRADWV